MLTIPWSAGNVLSRFTGVYLVFEGYQTNVAHFYFCFVCIKNAVAHVEWLGPCSTNTDQMALKDNGIRTSKSQVEKGLNLDWIPMEKGEP